MHRDEAAGIDIYIAHRACGSAEWVSVGFDENDYFQLNPSEQPRLDSVPIRDHACEYLPVSRRDLAQTRITLVDQSDGSSRVITETFFANGTSRLIERTDSNAAVTYREIILDVDGAGLGEVLRLTDDSGRLELVSHHVYERMPDGSLPERQLFPPSA